MTPVLPASWRFPCPGRQRGFSLLELVVVICLVALLGGVAFERFAEYQAQADRAAMRGVEQGLKTALTLQAAHITQQQGASHLRRLETENPFDLLAEKPSNYLGLLPADRTARRPGHWYYDHQGRRIIYMQRIRDNWLQAGSVQPVAYRVVVRYGSSGAEAVLLVPVDEGK